MESLRQFIFDMAPHINLYERENHAMLYSALGRDATLPWSRALTPPPEVNQNSSPGYTRSRGQLTPRCHTLSWMVAILDFMPLFGLRTSWIWCDKYSNLIGFLLQLRFIEYTRKIVYISTYPVYFRHYKR